MSYLLLKNTALSDKGSILLVGWQELVLPLPVDNFGHIGAVFDNEVVVL